MKILLTGKLGEGKYATVDSSSYHLVKKYKWYLHNAGYAFAKIKQKTVLMHRLIMLAKENECIDHANGDRLDNRKSNLRACSHSENLFNKGPLKRNKSGYKGVVFEKRSKKNPWVAYVRANGKNINLGCYPTKEEAALSYNKAALKYHGKFAFLNKLEGD